MRVPKQIYEKSGIIWTFKELHQDYGLKYSMHPDYPSIIFSHQMVETHFTRKGRPEPSRELVKQGKYECAPAALATLLDLPLKEVKKAYREVGWKNSKKGATNWITHQAARLLGCELIRIPEPTNRPCLIGLPSLNVKGMGHAVCWDGKEILDPNWDFPGRYWWGTEWGPETIGGQFFYVPYNVPMPQEERTELARLNVEMRREERLKEEAMKAEIAKALGWKD